MQRKQDKEEPIEPLPVFKHEHSFDAPPMLPPANDNNNNSNNNFLQRKCAHCEEEEKEQLVNRKESHNDVPVVNDDFESYVGSLGNYGSPLPAETKNYFEPRFGYDFSNVKVHTDTVAAKSADNINAFAYTSGNNIVFNQHQFSHGPSNGKKLLAHELTHVVQQAGNGKLHRNKLVQRQHSDAQHTGAASAQRLEFLPSVIPCACMVFIHNNETNARWAAETLHQNCHYNLAIIGAGQSRNVPIRGTSGQQDPNELFPANIQEECTRDEAGCVTYERSHNDLRAMQIQFFLTIKACSQNFQLPTVALHNNTITDTGTFLRTTTPSQREGLRGNFSRETGEGIGSRQDLRGKLGAGSGILSRSGTTNIYRWCNLPEISRCHIGDPHHPDDVIWVTTAQDFDRLRQENVNVALQEGLTAASGSESETDLSTLFLRLGPDVRYINIETPITPQDQSTRNNNLSFIQQVLEHVGLNCCEPVGDFPTPSRTEVLA